MPNGEQNTEKFNPLDVTPDPEGVLDRHARKKEPVRTGQFVVVGTAVATMLLDKFGITTFTDTEIVLLVSFVSILVGEIVRLKVFAPAADGPSIKERVGTRGGRR
jgi:hypothetical protein